MALYLDCSLPRVAELVEMTKALAARCIGQPRQRAAGDEASVASSRSSGASALDLVIDQRVAAPTMVRTGCRVIIFVVSSYSFPKCRLVAALVLTLSGCQTVHTTAPGAVGVDRKQHMLVSEEAVEGAAATAYTSELGKARAGGRLNANADETARVRRISARLIKQTQVFRPDAADWKWDVNVVTEPDINAYCMPGGKIVVYTGLIEQLKLTDPELATVIGHEMAHALREHSREAVSRAYAQQIGLESLALLTGMGGSTLELASAVTEVTFTLPRSRVQEAEADRIGLELMARAGYDPHAALDLWRKMSQTQTGGTPAFLSTHPTSSTRLSDLEALLPRVVPLYQAAAKE